MAIDSEFVRPSIPFEKEFGQFRNWWARDKRIVGNAFSLLMYLLSHERSFRVTQRKAQADLGLGRDAFLGARRRLEGAGFLTLEEVRFPAGHTDREGNPIGGHRRLVFTLQDPPEPNEIVATTGVEASADNPRRLPDEGRDPVDNSQLGQESSDKVAENAPTDEACAGNPTQAFPRLKEDQVKENQSSSSDVVADPVDEPAADREKDDDDDFDAIAGGFGEGTATLLRELHPGLDLRQLVKRLRTDQRLNVAAIDLEVAATDIVTSASGRIGNPVAYVATSILREPGRWVRAELLDPEPEQSARRAPDRGSRPPTAAECAAAGHQFIGPWRECCAGCGDERPGWRDDRDRHDTLGGQP